MFERFSSLTRFSQGWTITEKIDGANAQVVIDRLTSSDDGVFRDQAIAVINRPFDAGNPDNPYNNMYVFAGSRSRLITPDDDNYGFARWVRDNAETLVDTLGEGRHFGEWWGRGIQRGYGLREKRFSLFNVHRWIDSDLPEGVSVVPHFLLNQYTENPGEAAANALEIMRATGSLAAPGFMDPEGIVMHHRASGVSFKKTYDYDEFGKWRENQERRAVGDE